MLRTVTAEHLRGLVSWPDAVEAVRAALTGLAVGSVVQPPPLELRVPGRGELHVKGGHVAGSEWIVVKVATGGFSGATPSGCFVVLDAGTGKPCWLLDDDGWLTQQRTAAAATLATVTMAPVEARSLLVVGTGSLVALLIDAHRAVLPGMDITVCGRDPDRTRALARSKDIRMTADLAGAVSASDVVITATSSRAPVLRDEWVIAGTHITALGADTRGKQELPSALLRRADLLVCDDIGTARQAGELQHADALTAARAVAWPRFLADGTAREASAITISDLCGLGAEDATIASAAIAALS